MKTTNITMCLIAVIIMAFISCRKEITTPPSTCGSTYYYYFEEKIYLEKSPTALLIGFKEKLSFEKASEIINETGYLEPLIKEHLTQTGIEYVSVKIRGTRTCEEVKHILSILKQNDMVAYANQYLHSVKSKSKDLLGIMDIFIVGLKDSGDYPMLLKFAEEKNVKVINLDSSASYYFLKVDKTSTKDALEMANYFQECGLFWWAQPDVLGMITPGE